MEQYGTEERVRRYIRQCVSFHGFAPPGLLIGAFMVDLALEQLGANPGEKLYAVAETPKCAPDAVQVLTGATLGNNRLRIIETGKFSITLNRSSTAQQADAVRVYVDARKIRRYPTLNLWYTNDPSYERIEEKNRVYDEILKAARRVLSAEWVKVSVPKKALWRAVQCPVCNEMVPDYFAENGVCPSCAGTAYYDRPAKARNR